MPLVKMTELFPKYGDNSYAIGAFNVSDMEMAMGAMKAAEELQAPIILQIAEVRLKQSPLHVIGPLMVAAAKAAKVPVAVHFDHGKTMEKISEALSVGFAAAFFAHDIQGLDVDHFSVILVILL